MKTPTPHAPRPAAHPAADDDLFDQGLQADLQTLLRQQTGRRQWLRWVAAGTLGASGGLGLIACGGGGDDSTTSSDSSSSSGSSSGSGSGSGSGTGSGTDTCSVIPSETAGPYPGDGSNRANGSVANALALSGIVRSDIRSSIGSASGTAEGVTLTVTLTLVNTNGSCASLEGYAIYLWHCDAQGRYSMYSSGVTDENYLRGVQVTDANGQASFTTIYPGCYSGRWPHMHFEIYGSSEAATSYANKLHTSQLALPLAVNNVVYAESAYSGSAANQAGITLSSDNVFGDGADTQLAEVTGSVDAGYAATLQVGIAV